MFGKKDRDRDHTNGQTNRATNNRTEFDAFANFANYSDDVWYLKRAVARLENQVQMILLATGYEIHSVPEVPAVLAHEEIRKRKK